MMDTQSIYYHINPKTPGSIVHPKFLEMLIPEMKKLNYNIFLFR